jgi:hypothetical protein
MSGCQSINPITSCVEQKEEEEEKDVGLCRIKDGVRGSRQICPRKGKRCRWEIDAVPMRRRASIGPK